MESERYCDIVQMDFIDHYQNVSLDSISAIKFALGLKATSEIPDFLAIADDDVFINIPAVYKILFQDNFINKSSPFMLGNVFRKLRVSRPKSRRFSLHLQMPKYIYNAKKYPDFLDGGFYILPRFTWKCLYEAVLFLPLFPWNDVFITGTIRFSTKCKQEVNNLNDPAVI